MAGPLMAPRSYDYSGEADPRDLNVAIGTSAPVQGTQKGFLGTLDEIAGKIAPLVEAAVAFKRGYQGYPIPGSQPGDSRMAGQRFIFEVLEDMRQRNETAQERARTEREAARKEDLRNQILMKAWENKEITTEDLMKELGAGEIPGLGGSRTQEPQAPAAPTN